MSLFLQDQKDQVDRHTDEEKRRPGIMHEETLLNKEILRYL
jgi:hypothetical protein